MEQSRSKERRADQKAQVRAKLLEVARELLARGGQEAVTLRAVAEAIGYTAPAIYVHFPDKQSLMRAIMADDFARLSGSFAALASVADPLERIKHVGRAYIKHAIEHPQAFELLMMTRHDASVYEAKKQVMTADPSHNAYAFLRMCVAHAVGLGLAKGGARDCDLLAQTLWAGVHGVATLAITKCTDPTISWASQKARTECMVQVLIEGLFEPMRANAGQASGGFVRTAMPGEEISK
jgi:AcrR family transcriptional regulator